MSAYPANEVPRKLNCYKLGLFVSYNALIIDERMLDTLNLYAFNINNNNTCPSYKLIKSHAGSGICSWQLLQHARFYSCVITLPQRVTFDEAKKNTTCH